MTYRKNFLFILLSLFLLWGCGEPEEKAARYLSQGKAYFEKGNYVKASLELRNALQANDRLTEAWFLLSRISKKKGDWPNTLLFSNKTVELDPAHLKARLTLGKLYLAGKQLDKALTQSNALMKLNDSDASVRALRAAVLYRLSDVNGALSEAEKAVELDPANVDGLIVLASLKQQEGAKNKAISLIDQGLAKNPNHLALHIIKIQILEKSDQPDAAIRAYEAAIKARPENLLLRHALAKLYARTRNIGKAESVLREMISTKPARTDLKLRFVNFLLKERDAEAAFKTLAKFIKEEPDNIELRFGLASTHNWTGNAEKAKEVYREIIAKEQNNTHGLSAKSKLAAIIIGEKDKAEGERLLKEVIDIDSRNSEALLIRGALRLKQYKTEEGIADLRSVLRDAPFSANALLLLARAHRQSGANDLANGYYVKAIATNPERLDIRLEYGRFLMRRNLFSRAGEVLLALLAYDPNNVPALHAMTEIRLIQQDWAGAQEYARKVEKGGGDVNFSEQVMGSVYLAQKKIDLSIAAFKRAHLLAPKSSRPMVALVRTYVRHGKREEAKKFLSNVIRAYQGNVMAYVLLGQIYTLEESWDKAEEVFRRVKEIRPKSPIGYRSLTALHFRKGDYAASEKALLEGLAAIPENITLRISMAGLSEKRKDFEKAIKIYEKIVSNNPEVNIAVNNLASMLSDHRTDPESLRRALDLAKRFRNSKFPFFLDTLGWIHYRMNNYERAIRYLEKVVEALPAVAIFRYHLGMSYLAVNNRPSAKKELEKAVSLGNKKDIWLEEAKNKIKTHWE